MKSKVLALFLLAGSSVFAAPRIQVAVGFGGGYAAPYPGYYAPPPPAVVEYAPAYRPGFARVGGYWYPAGARYGWHPGYWAHPPYYGARWEGPRYGGGRYDRGFWRR
jgi:hypothetical protein